MKNYVICDIDGTIANNEHRAHILKELVDSDKHRSSEDLKDDRWTRFYDLCDKDTPYSDIRSLLKALNGDFYSIVYLTGRIERIRGKTTEWLWGHGFPVGGLEMRADGDYRPNAEFKLARLTELGLTPDKVLCILEDNDVEALRAAGYRVLHVAPGGIR
jgi:hypothetical protein